MTGLQYITVGKAWQQEHEAAGHRASTVRTKTEMNAGAQLSLLLFSPVLPTFRVGFPTSINPSLPDTLKQRFVFWVVLDLVKMTIKHHRTPLAHP